MPLAFADICALLSRLEDIETREPPLLRAAEKFAANKQVTESWFKSHRKHINALRADEAVGLLSTLVPERRTDRVYGIQAPRLCRILSRCLSLGAARVKDLQVYREPGKGDLGVCLERVLSAGGPPATPKVTVDEIDEMLQVLAGASRFSDPGIPRLPPGSSAVRDQLLVSIFLRLSPMEGKWLVRVILKDFSPVRINEHLTLKTLHFLLPDLLRFQNNFQAAVAMIKGPLKSLPENPDLRSEQLFRDSAACLLKPEVGVKVGRSTFHKARSIDHCMRMLAGKKWVLERKYDGEYCEIHIDLNLSPKPVDCITFYSKSGKNSTADRSGLCQTLVDCLRLSQSDRRIQRKAILLGEMVVYSDRGKTIMPFERIRKHVTRSGSFLGADEDSHPDPQEHLAIVFFDILVLDNEMLLTKPVEERRIRLREIYTKVRGRAMGAEWKIVDFGHAARGRHALLQQFAASVAQRCEGLVLKACGVPYFSLHPDLNEGTHGYIKLKKDYIEGMGDEADFAVVGGSYNAQQALKIGNPRIKWTDFHLGCLLNKADVLRFDARPQIKVVGTVRAEACIPGNVLETANTVANFSATPFDRAQVPAHFGLDVPNTIKIDSVFNQPLVFEVLGSGFEKPPNSNIFMLRHPRVKKLHQDRSWRDCVSLQELQEQAAAARNLAADSESQETRRWIEKLERKAKRKFERESIGTPKSGTTTTPTTGSRTASVKSRRPSNAQSKSGDGSRSNVSIARSPSGSTRSALNGTTLIATSSLPPTKRTSYDTQSPCPAAKRRCMNQTTLKISTGLCAQGSALSHSSPLADITNHAPHPDLPLRKDVSEREVPQASRSNHYRSMIPDSDPAFSPASSVGSSTCRDPHCPFLNSTIYLAPCIAHMPYVTQDLLVPHNAIIAPKLEYWDRDSFSHPPGTAEVAESQAFEGTRKIVLAEPRRGSGLRGVVREIERLNIGRFRERVEVWDWRALECCIDLARQGVRGGREMDEYLVGAMVFDEVQGRARFESGLSWLDKK